MSEKRKRKVRDIYNDDRTTKKICSRNIRKRKRQDIVDDISNHGMFCIDFIVTKKAKIEDTRAQQFWMIVNDLMLDQHLANISDALQHIKNRLVIKHKSF